MEDKKGKMVSLASKPRNFLNLTGQIFGRLQVLSYAGSDKRGKAQWNCKCECNKEVIRSSSNLKRGLTTSCGNHRQGINAKHSMSDSSEYEIWSGMIKRCTNPNNKSYARYGGRGVKVCQRWLESFKNFYADMGDRPSSLHTLDRKENGGDYTPDNCRWATQKEQQRNRGNNRRVEYKGELVTIAELAEISGIRYSVLFRRLFKWKWDVDKAITAPIRVTVKTYS